VSAASAAAPGAAVLDIAPLTPSRRADGWTAATQRRFLEAIAEGFGVEHACRTVGLSTASAYAFRRTAAGAAFALGWRAATLVARESIAETLLVRALEGQVDTVVRPDGTTLTRHRYDNRLATSLLARLDRQVESVPDADVKAARLVAQEFDAFLALVDRDEGPARAGLFLASRSAALGDAGEAAPDLAPLYALATADRITRTGLATAADVCVADLDPAQRRGWSAEQWARAEAAGLVALACPAQPAPETAPEPQESQHSHVGPPADPIDANHIWWDEDLVAWRTNLPPPPDLLDDTGDYTAWDYARYLSDDEQQVWEAASARRRDRLIAADQPQREAYFATLRALAAPPAPDPAPDDPAPAPPKPRTRRRTAASATSTTAIATGLATRARTRAATGRQRNAAPDGPLTGQP
jgi:hypothetical protein